MANHMISGGILKEMVVSAVGYLELNKELLNGLNVFPVPDGDTGTNMLLTLVSAAREVNACADSDTAAKVARALAAGALKGARGNSGVILSQLFRGFASAVPKDAVEIDSACFAACITKGVEAAYKAVMKPKEGTILTVARGMADEAARQTAKHANLFSLIDAVIEAGEATLKKTPDMLPVLKEAGVVDAGGAGLLIIYKGFKMALDGEEYPTTELDLTLPKTPAAATSISTADIKYGYCTEFFITDLESEASEPAIDRLREKLAQIGDSIVVVGDSALIKIHVHTNVPGKALQYALRYGQLDKVKIENMRHQHSELADGAASGNPAVPEKPYSVIAVAPSEQLGSILTDCGADGLVSGGQSMNPSAEDIRLAVEAAPSQNVIILPNNKNIILAAKQVSQLTKKIVHVIDTKSFPQGLSSLLAFSPEKSLEVNLYDMADAISQVRSAQVTLAVRDSHTNGFYITEGEALGIYEGDIVAHGGDKTAVTKELLSKMTDKDFSVITLYYGSDVPEAEAEALLNKLCSEFSGCDIELIAGGQPVYHYIISVE